MHSQSPTSEYAFTDMHGKHETDITVDKNGHVNTKDCTHINNHSFRLNRKSDFIYECPMRS